MSLFKIKEDAAYDISGLQQWTGWTLPYPYGIAGTPSFYGAHLSGLAGVGGNRLKKGTHAGIFPADDAAITDISAKYDVSILVDQDRKPSVPLASLAGTVGWLPVLSGYAGPAYMDTFVEPYDEYGNQYVLPRVYAGGPLVPVSITPTTSRMCVYTASPGRDIDGGWIFTAGSGTRQCPCPTNPIVFMGAEVPLYAPDGGVYAWTFNTGTGQWAQGAEIWGTARATYGGWTYAAERSETTGIIDLTPIPYCGSGILASLRGNVDRYSSSGYDVEMLPIHLPTTYRACQVRLPTWELLDPFYTYSTLECIVMAHDDDFPRRWIGRDLTTADNSDAGQAPVRMEVYAGPIDGDGTYPCVADIAGGWTEVTRFDLPTGGGANQYKWEDLDLSSLSGRKYLCAGILADGVVLPLPIGTPIVYIVPGPSPCPVQMFARDGTAY